MKIEIAEILIQSYLKHIEGCRIVQTNWKTSSQWKLTEYDEEQAKILFEEVKLSPSLCKIFKNNSFNQLIKQAEIDVLGLNTTERSIFGIDVAFHALGLNYGDPVETASRIMKKIFRTIFIMQSYFKEFHKFNSYFVTPRVNPAYKTPIENLINEGKQIIKDDSISIEFISNDDFYLKMVDPLVSNVSEDNDTMELFSRAIKLLQLDSRSQVSTLIKKPAIQTLRTTVTEKRTENGMKIGQFVQYNMRKVFEEKLVGEEEIKNLQDRSYSKRVFNQNFEVLRNIKQETKDETGRNRYYTNEIFFGSYHLTSQWFEYHWEPFINWLHRLRK